LTPSSGCDCGYITLTAQQNNKKIRSQVVRKKAREKKEKKKSGRGELGKMRRKEEIRKREMKIYHELVTAHVF